MLLEAMAHWLRYQCESALAAFWSFPTVRKRSKHAHVKQTASCLSMPSWLSSAGVSVLCLLNYDCANCFKRTGETVGLAPSATSALEPAAMIAPTWINCWIKGSSHTMHYSAILLMENDGNIGTSAAFFHPSRWAAAARPVSDTTRGSTGSPQGSRSSPDFRRSMSFQKKFRSDVSGIVGFCWKSSRFGHLLPDFGTTLGQIRPRPIASSCQVQDLEVHQLTVVGDKGANLGTMATTGDLGHKNGDSTSKNVELGLSIVYNMYNARKKYARKYFCWAGFRIPLKW